MTLQMHAGIPDGCREAARGSDERPEAGPEGCMINIQEGSVWMHMNMAERQQALRN